MVAEVERVLSGAKTTINEVQRSLGIDTIDAFPVFEAIVSGMILLYPK